MDFAHNHLLSCAIISQPNVHLLFAIFELARPESLHYESKPYWGDVTKIRGSRHTFPSKLPNCPNNWQSSFDNSNKVVCQYRDRYYLYEINLGKFKCKIRQSFKPTPDAKSCWNETVRDILVELESQDSVEEKPNFPPCQSQPCQSGGTCEEIEAIAYQCLCPKGTDPSNDCAPCSAIGRWGPDCKYKCGACSSHSARVRWGGIKSCSNTKGCDKCLPGVTKPPLCNKVDCTTATCRHGAECVDDLCLCPYGYTGVLCESDLLRDFDVTGRRNTTKCAHMKNRKKPSVTETLCIEKKSCYILTEHHVKRCVLPCTSKITQPCPAAKQRPCSEETAEKECSIHSRCLIIEETGKEVCRCLEGWSGKRCYDKCLDGAENCLHGTCDEEELCTCDLGYFGAYCQYACPAGLRGVRRTRRKGVLCAECGHCYIRPCDFITGVCPKKPGKPQCIDYYMPPDCRKWDTIKGGPTPVELEGHYKLNGEWVPQLANPASTLHQSVSDNVRQFVAANVKRMGRWASDLVVQSVYIARANAVTKLRRKRGNATISHQLGKDMAIQMMMESTIRRSKKAQGIPVRTVNMARRARQAGSTRAGVAITFSVLVSPDELEDGFEERLTASMKNHAQEFKAGNYTIDVASIVIDKVQLNADGDVVREDFPVFSVYFVLGGLTLFLGVGAMLYFVLQHHRATRDQRRASGKQTAHAKQLMLYRSSHSRP